MRKLLASALLIASLAGCAASSTPALTEDSPGWDCATMGNRICTPLDTRTGTQATAWEIWDNGGGSSKLRVDPSRPYRVDFVGASETYPHQAPAEDALAVGKDGRWYWFHLTYTD